MALKLKLHVLLRCADMADGVVDAMPVSFKLPSDDTGKMEKSVDPKLKSPLSKEKADKADGVVNAVPISLKPPKDSTHDATKMEKCNVNPGLKLKSPMQSEDIANNGGAEASLMSFKQPKEYSIDDTSKMGKTLQALRDFVTRMSMSKENVGQFSLAERLNGWTFQQRPRSNNGRFDSYYFHKKANWIFRSRIEVFKFVLHEIYPERQPPRPDKGKAKIEESTKSEEPSPPEEMKKVGETSRKRRVPQINVDNGGDDHRQRKKARKEEMRRLILVGLLRAAHENLLRYEGEEDGYKDASPRTVEKFLKESFNGLLNQNDDGAKRPSSSNSPADTPVQAPAEAPGEVLIETRAEVPMRTPVQTPAAHVPAEAPDELVPIETTMRALAIETPVELVPSEGAAEMMMGECAGGGHKDILQIISEQPHYEKEQEIMEVDEDMNAEVNPGTGEAAAAAEDDPDDVEENLSIWNIPMFEDIGSLFVLTPGNAANHGRNSSGN